MDTIGEERALSAQEVFPIGASSPSPRTFSLSFDQHAPKESIQKSRPEQSTPGRKGAKSSNRMWPTAVLGLLRRSTAVASDSSTLKLEQAQTMNTAWCLC